MSNHNGSRGNCYAQYKMAPRRTTSVVSLYMVYSHLSERSERRLVLAEGRSALATAYEPSGLEYVTVRWTDSEGRNRFGTAWTRKRFLEKTGRAPTPVDIKYVSDSRIAPVILSEIAEREWVNTFWVYALPIMSLFAGSTVIFGYRKAREQRPLTA